MLVLRAKMWSTRKKGGSLYVCKATPGQCKTEVREVRPYNIHP